MKISELPLPFVEEVNAKNQIFSAVWRSELVFLTSVPEFYYPSLEIDKIDRTLMTGSLKRLDVLLDE